MKEKRTTQLPKNQDHLEVYPEKKQVSAFPERRFIKTNRTLAITALINLACILAGTGLYIYSATRINVKITDKQNLHFYQMDTEAKILRQTQYRNTKIPAKYFIIEQALYNYIKDRHEVIFNREEMEKKISNGYAIKLSDSKLLDTLNRELQNLFANVFNRNINRDVHIYNLHQHHNNIWTAVIETFDFQQTDQLKPQCPCYDNSSKCLKCKNEQTIHKERRRVWIRVSLKGEKNEENPFGIRVDGYYMGYMPINPDSTDWDLPPELTPNLLPI